MLVMVLLILDSVAPKCYGGIGDSGTAATAKTKKSVYKVGINTQNHHN